MTKKIGTRTEEQKENTITLENAGRRKVVKTIVGGVTAVAAYNLLPSKWGTPIIEQVFLPAHAATSGVALHDPCTVTILSGDQSTNSVVVRVNGYVTPPTANLPTKIVATPVGAGAAVTANTTTAADGTFTADLTVTGGPGITSVNAATTVQGADGSAACKAETSSAPATEECPSLSYNVSIVNDSSYIQTVTVTPFKCEEVTTFTVAPTSTLTQELPNAGISLVNESQTTGVLYKTNDGAWEGPAISYHTSITWDQNIFYIQDVAEG